MTKTYLLRAASSIALIAAMSTAALSQSSGGPSSGGGAQGPAGGSSTQSAPSQSPTQSPAQRDKAGPGSGDTTEVPKSGGGSAERPADRPKASDRAQDKASPKSSVQGGTKGDEPRGSRAAGDRAKDGKPQSRDQSRDSDRDQSRTVGEEGGKDDRGDGARREKAADSKRGDGGERVQISQQQRTTVRERLSKHGQRNRVNNVNFDIRVGVNVPRNVSLHVLPPDVVEIVPQYRNNRYVYVGDQYLIIDPYDYVIVAVIGGDSRSATRRSGSFTLAADDRVFFRRHVDRGPSIRMGIGGISIGMNLPDSVELRPVPSVIVDRMPDLEGHRYFFYEDEIVIVDPDSRQVVYVIED